MVQYDKVEEKGKKAIGAAVRAGFQIVAGALIAKGISPELVGPIADQGTALVTGLGVAAFSYGWSLIQKRVIKLWPF